MSHEHYIAHYLRLGTGSTNKKIETLSAIIDKHQAIPIDVFDMLQEYANSFTRPYNSEEEVG